MPRDRSLADFENAASFTLDRILRGESPILRVRHDADDGAWQFLDDREADASSVRVVPVGTVADVDPTIRELADLPEGWTASRRAVGEPWSRSPIPDDDLDDDDEAFRADVREHGWRVVMISEDEDGPAFAYSVGLFASFGHPEIVLVGLDPDLMHALIDNLGEDVRNGAAYSPGRRADDVLENYPVEFREVARTRYGELLGHARWFYDGDDFPALQCVWPDMEGRFPDDPDAHEAFRRAQPLLDS